MSAEFKSDAPVSPANETQRPEPTNGLTEDQVLALLQGTGVTADFVSVLARTPAILKSRKLILAIVSHPRTPRHIAIPLLRRMFTFDLLRVTLAPLIAADLRRIAEDQIIIRLESLSTGEKTALARRSSGRVAAALLLEPDTRIIGAALDNSRLTERLVVTALMKPAAPEQLFDLASQHRNWGNRREVQVALLRSEKTPLERVAELSAHFSPDFLMQILPESRKRTSRSGHAAS